MPQEVRYEVNRPDVVDETVDGEVLIVHLGTGNYYSSRGSGEVAWQLLAGGATLDEVAGAVDGGVAGGEARAAIERYLTTLLTEDLLRSRSDVPAPVNSVAFADFTEPTLEKYTDMQEFLLLDPIHDVEETGWPNVKAEAPGH